MDSLDALRWGTAGVIVLIIAVVVLGFNPVAAALALVIVGVIAILYWAR